MTESQRRDPEDQGCLTVTRRWNPVSQPLDSQAGQRSNDRFLPEIARLGERGFKAAPIAEKYQFPVCYGAEFRDYIQRFANKYTPLCRQLSTAYTRGNIAFMRE